MGPFFTRVLMKELLSLADNEVDRMIATHCLLAVITEDEVELFPAFQFNADRNQVRASIGHLLQILLASGVNPWVVVYWLTAPIKERENQRPIDLVDQDEQTRNLLLNMAREDAARWHMVWQHNE